MKRMLFVSTLVATTAAVAVLACGDDSSPGDEQDADSGTGTDAGTAPLDSGGGVVTDSGEPGDTDASDGGKTGMSFFVTSTGSGAAGGNLGGLAGADAKCQTLATAVGAGDRTWRAYLSTNTNNGGTLVHAKDYIGAGPWYNQKNELVAENVGACRGHHRGAHPRDRRGSPTSGPNQHDILTGTNADGCPAMAPRALQNGRRTPPAASGP